MSVVTRPIIAVLTVITLISQCTLGQFGQHCTVNFQENSLLETVFGLVSFSRAVKSKNIRSTYGLAGAATKSTANLPICLYWGSLESQYCTTL